MTHTHTVFDNGWIGIVKVDLEIAMKDKPPQDLENTKAYARRMIHPISKAVLYEYISFAGSSTEVSSSTAERNVTASSSDVVKPAKRVKAIEGEASAPKRIKADEKQPKQPTLAGKGLEKIQKVLEEITELAGNTHWKDLCDFCSDIPRAYSNRLRIKHAELITVQCELTIAVSSGVGKAAALVAMARVAKDQYKDITGKIDNQVQELKDMGVEVGME